MALIDLYRAPFSQARSYAKAEPSLLDKLSQLYLHLYLFLGFTDAFKLTPSALGIYPTDVLAIPCLYLVARKNEQFFENLKRVSVFPIVVAIYIVWGLLTSPVVNDELATRAWQQMFWATLPCVTAAALLDGPQAFRRLVDVFQIGAIFVIYLCIRQIGHPALFSQFRDSSLNQISIRPGAIYGNPNIVGLHLAFAMIVSIWAHKWLRIVSFVAIVLGLYICASREAILVTSLFLVVMVIYGLIAASKAKNRLLSSAYLAAIALFAIVGFFPSTLGGLTSVGFRYAGTSEENSDRLKHLLDASDAQGRGTRAYLFEKWLEVAEEGPVQGYGLYAMEGRQGIRPIANVGPHNMYLAVWIDCGIFFLIGFIGTLLWSLISQVRKASIPSFKFHTALAWSLWIVMLNFWHNAFEAANWTICWAVLYLLPVANANAEDGNGLPETKAVNVGALFRRKGALPTIEDPRFRPPSAGTSLPQSRT